MQAKDIMTTSVFTATQDGKIENAIRVAVANVSGVHSVDMHMGRLAAWAYGI